MAAPTSADAKKVTSDLKGKIAFVSYGYGNAEICVVNADGSNLTRLTYDESSDDSPRFSPDGKKIIFTSLRAGGDEICLMDSGGRNARQLTKNEWLDSYPSFSYDGKKIVWTSWRDNSNEVCVMNVDGSEQRQLTKDKGEDNFPCFSPDGTKIAFVSDRTGTPQIYLVNADGSNTTQLTHDSNGCSAPRFSPDGKVIVFTKGDMFTTSGIYVVNVDGSKPPRRLDKEGAESDSSPCFSPDGKHIAWASKRNNQDDIYVMNVDGTQVRRITTGGGVGQLSWGIGSVPTPPPVKLKPKVPAKKVKPTSKPTAKSKPVPTKKPTPKAKAQLAPTLDKALFEATRRADVARMTDLIKRGANINARDRANDGITPIYAAIGAKSLPAVRLLISKKANVSAGVSYLPELMDEYGLGIDREASPLDYATYLKQVEIVKVLLQAGAQSFGENETAQVFRIAAYRDSVEIMRLLLDEDEGQSRAHNASSALAAAVGQNSLEMTKLLVANGADSKSCSEALLSACILASRDSRKIEIAFAVLPNVGDPNIKDTSGNTALLCLTYHADPVIRSVENVPFFSPSLSPQEREKVRHWLEGYNKQRQRVIELASALMAKGAKPDLLSVGGYTPLLLAIEKADGDFVRALLDGGANPNYSPSPFPSPLRFLAQSGHLGKFLGEYIQLPSGDVTAEEAERVKSELSLKDVEMARMLIEKGADPKIGDNRFALGEAALRGNTPLVRELVEKGVDVNLPFIQRDYFIPPVHRELTKTAHEAENQEREYKTFYASKQPKLQGSILQLAVMIGNLDVVRELLAAGANVNASDAQGRNALHNLAIGGRLALLETAERNSAYMVREIAGINTTEHELIMPLPTTQFEKWYKWASEGDLAIATALIDAGCAVNPSDTKPPSLLQLAAQNSELPVVDLLLKKGAMVPRSTILFEVIEHGRRQKRVTPALTMLQGRLIEADRIDFWGREFPVTAAQKKLFTPDAKAQKDRTFAFAERALLLKIWGQKDAEIIARLIEAGADVNARNGAGLTPLMLAARLGQTEVVRALMAAGADSKATNRSGETTAAQVAKYGAHRAALPIKEQPQTGEVAGSWEKAPAIQSRQALIRQKLQSENSALLGLLAGKTK